MTPITKSLTRIRTKTNKARPTWFRPCRPGRHFRWGRPIMNFVHPEAMKVPLGYLLYSSNLRSRLNADFQGPRWPAKVVLRWHGHLAHDFSRAGRPCHDGFSGQSPLACVHKGSFRQSVSPPEPAKLWLQSRTWLSSILIDAFASGHLKT